ncbi:unnamed protein product [Rotaria sp. Silwood1]|nr:unnamed protein product [Rotaria sp. Silwood1]
MLKYGKFSFGMYGTSPDLSITNNEQQEYSPIEHLIIDGYCQIHQFNAILSYSPRLRYFSCEYLSSFGSTQIEVSMIPLYLTHLSIKYCLLSFDEFELFIVKNCSQLKMLRISTKPDIAYLDASRWERLISHHMYHLSIFDFEHLMRIGSVENIQVYHAMINQFVSSFWIERQWFFAHQHCSKRKQYYIFERADQDTCSCRETGLNLTENICIEGRYLIPNCSIQFASATSLSFQYDYSENRNQFINDLNHCIPLAQIRRLCISYSNLDTDMLVKILCCMPNLESFDPHYRPLKHLSTRYATQEAQIAHLVSQNKIKSVHRRCR